MRAGSAVSYKPYRCQNHENQGGKVQYQTFRSVSDNHLFVLCYEDTFYEITPAHVRHLGPWQAQHRGDVYELKPEYRLALVRDGSCS
jgi:hypothetical protein